MFNQFPHNIVHLCDKVLPTALFLYTIRTSKPVTLAVIRMAYKLSLFGQFRFGTGYLELRCSKSCYPYNFELVGLGLSKNFSFWTVSLDLDARDMAA